MPGPRLQWAATVWPERIQLPFGTEFSYCVKEGGGEEGERERERARKVRLRYSLGY